MTITHDPELDAREPRDGDLELFDTLEPGDEITFFEWPVEPLTVLEREPAENVGERIRVQAEGSESFLYKTNDTLWHYTPEEQYSGDNNPYPVQALTRTEQNDVANEA